MPSYFRNIFGGGSNTQSSAANSKTHSHSTPPHIYAAPGSSSSSANMQRTYSYSASRSTTPSPLRYPAGSDTRTTLGYGKSSAHVEIRPHARRRATYEPGEPANYAMHTPSTPYVTPPSSRSNSSSSLFGMGAAPYMSSSSDGHGVRYASSRPVLRQNQTWHPGSSAGSASSYGSVRGHSPVHSSHSTPRSSHSPARSSPSHSPTSATFARSRTPSLHMHPLFAYTRLHRAPLTYDVTFTPSARTVLDRATHSAIPSHTLAQPATEPPTAAGARLVLRSHKFPWPVVVAPSSAPRSSPGPRFTVAPAKTGAISNLDVLYAVHATLMVPVTPDEWTSLGHGSRAQQKVTRAYERRCQRMGGGWEGGVRRVDWLGEKTRLVGVEIDKSGAPGGAGKLVFGKA